MLAKLNPAHLAAPIKHGIAPAMNSDPRKTFWGSEGHQEWTVDFEKVVATRMPRWSAAMWSR